MKLPKKRVIALLNRYLGLNNNDIERRYKETSGEETLNLLHDLHEIRALNTDEICDQILECGEDIEGFEVKNAKQLYLDYLEMQSMIKSWLAIKEQQFMHDHTTNPYRVYANDDDNDDNDDNDVENKIEFAKMARFKTSLFAALKDFDLLIRLVHHDALNFPKVVDVAEEYYSNH